MDVKTIIGLGNPGERYAQTRHNLGFMVLDELARRSGCRFKPGKGPFYFYRADFRTGPGKIMFVKPTTFMNRSGVAFNRILELENLKPEEILIVVDDFELPFGQLRIRKFGSAGSHNGLASIIYQTGMDSFPRLRIGIGNPSENIDPADYVLAVFSKAEEKGLPEIINGAADAIEVIIKDGLDIAMNQFNRKIEKE